MAKGGPGKAYREGLTLIQIMDMFPDNKTAEEWFTKLRWPGGPYCPRCGSLDVQENIKHKTMTHRCRDCHGRPMFSLKTGSLMEGSKLGYRIWALAIYLLSTNLKSVSSLKLHRDLGITQKTAWYLAHRIRKTFVADKGPFTGPVEVDETYIGGKRKNMHRKKRAELSGRGNVGKVAVVGSKDRATNRVSAHAVLDADAKTLHGFIGTRVDPSATVYTDEAAAYKGIPYEHESVAHSAGEYVRDMAHTNGMESFWSMLKRGYQGTFHYISSKHIERYVQEFAGRHNLRESNTVDQMAAVTIALMGKRLKYRDLIT